MLMLGAETKCAGGCLTVYVHISGGMIRAACIHIRLLFPTFDGQRS